MRSWPDTAQTSWLLLWLLAQSAAPPAAEIRTKVAEYMHAAVTVDGFSGTILVARDGQPIVSEGYGMANVELAVPNRPETVFRLGSITKQFTSMAVMMLQERGKLRVSDPVCHYLTACPPACRAAGQPLPISHVVRHPAGTPNYTSSPEFESAAALPTTAAEMIGMLKDKALEFAPGEKFAYSNSGYYVLGMIVEHASGKS